MKVEIFHHFGIKISREADAQVFTNLGVQLDRGPKDMPGASIGSFEISEDEPQWPIVRSLAEKVKITDFVRTRFSNSELDGANVLCVLASAHRGYPQPSKKMGYLEETYDLSEYCRECGIGHRQIRPFRIKSKPASKHSVLQLNWVFDEFFVFRDVWEEIFKPFDIDCWPVVSDETGEVSKSIVQLRISHKADLKDDIDSNQTCHCCGRTKSPLSLRGFAPTPIDIPAPIFRSTQYFGNGGNAFNRLFITAPLYREAQLRELRGIEYYPCILEPTT